MEFIISDVVDCLVDEALVRAHQEVAAETNHKRTSMLSDVPTEATDAISDSFYDADELLKSRTYDSDAVSAQVKGGQFHYKLIISSDGISAQTLSG